MLSRRGLLITGGAAALIGGLGTLQAANGPGLARARAPWSQAGQSFGDSRLDALAYAILAPNPHNRQPWQFELVGDDEILVQIDLDRRLPHTDPFDRQITIGFGCMLELLSMAAAEQGNRAEITAFPDGAAQPRLDARPVARVKLRPDDAPPDPLFAAVLERRSTKEPYDTSKPVSPDALSAILTGGAGALEVGGTIEPGQVARIVDLAWHGFQIELATDLTRRESVDLMRIGNRAVTRNPDGIDMGGLQMGLLKMAGMVSPESLDTPGSTAYQAGLDMYHPIIHSAQGFVWVTAPANTRLSQLEAGAAWVRMNLAAQQAGICVHPLSQVLQEFPEMAGPYQSLREALGVAGDGVVHMLGRVGFTRFPKPSPRWPLESKLIDQSV
ncbi:MAG: twin-arginine translocation pathway signal protein [Pseudomonadota bacterium]